MKKFIVIYHAPAEAFAAMGEMTEAQKQEGMKPWLAWMEKCGDNLVDGGSPLMGGQHIAADGNASASTREVAGYSILQANDMEAAKALLDGHPHLQWHERAAIEVHECMPLM